MHYLYTLNTSYTIIHNLLYTTYTHNYFMSLFITYYIPPGFGTSLYDAMMFSDQSIMYNFVINP